MSDPSYALQKALVARLKATSGVTDLVGTRIFDAVPKSAAFPYLTLGEVQVVPDEADCYAGAEVYFSVHAWAREPGAADVKRIAPAVQAAVLADDLALDGHTVVSVAFDGAQYMRDPDGLTSHAVISFIAETEPA